MQMAKMPDDLGMGRVGLVAAMVAALHADTDGAEKAHVSAVISRMQGYADAKTRKMAGARKIATPLPRSWAIHCARGGVLRRNLLNSQPLAGL